MIASISQTGTKWQEETSGTVPGGSQPLVTPKQESYQCPPGVSGGWHSHFPFKRFLPGQREETGLGCQMAMPTRPMSENIQEVNLLVLCEHSPQLREAGALSRDPG